MAMSMVKGTLTNVLPMIVLGGWISWVFSGFIISECSSVHGYVYCVFTWLNTAATIRYVLQKMRLLFKGGHYLRAAVCMCLSICLSVCLL